MVLCIPLHPNTYSTHIYVSHLGPLQHSCLGSLKLAASESTEDRRLYLVGASLRPRSAVTSTSGWRERRVWRALTIANLTFRRTATRSSIRIACSAWYSYSAHTGESPSMYTLTLMRTLVGGFSVHVHKLTDLLSVRTVRGNCKRRKNSISPPTRRTQSEVTSDLDQQMIQCTQSTSIPRAAQYA